jgi:hypothetical protein
MSANQPPAFMVACRLSAVENIDWLLWVDSVRSTCTMPTKLDP